MYMLIFIDQGHSSDGRCLVRLLANARSTSGLADRRYCRLSHTISIICGTRILLNLRIAYRGTLGTDSTLPSQQQVTTIRRRRAWDIDTTMLTEPTRFNYDSD